MRLFRGIHSSFGIRIQYFLGAVSTIILANLLFILVLYWKVSPVGLPSKTLLVEKTLSCAELHGLSLWSEGKYGGQNNLSLNAPKFSKKVAEQVIQKLDSHKLLFTKGEVDLFEKNISKAWDKFLSNHECEYFDRWINIDFHVVKERFYKRVQKLNLLSQFKKPPVEGESSSELATNFKNFAQDEGELFIRLEEFVDQIASNAPEILRRAYENDQKRLVLDTIDQLLFSKVFHSREILAKAILGARDSYSTYFSEEEFEDFYQELAGGVSGIGVKVRRVPKGFLIEKVAKGSPAEESRRIHRGDIIIAIDEVKLAAQSDQEVNQLFRGLPETQLKLEVEDDKTGKLFSVVLKRRHFSFEDSKITGKIVSIKELLKGEKNSGAIGIVKIPSFYGRGGIKSYASERSSSEDLEKVLKEILHSKKDVAGLVLDLRGNPGGYLEEAVSMAGLFVGNDPIVAVVNREGKRILKSENPMAFYRGPLVLLLDEESASASEVFAGALKDYQRAILVGTRQTYGKGSVQRLFHLDDELFRYGLDELSNAGVVKLTTSQYYSPLGHSPTNGGVLTHIPLITDLTAATREKELKGSRGARDEKEMSQAFVPRDAIQKIWEKEKKLQNYIDELTLRRKQRLSKIAQMFQSKPTSSKLVPEGDKLRSQQLSEAVAIAEDLVRLNSRTSQKN